VTTPEMDASAGAATAALVPNPTATSEKTLTAPTKPATLAPRLAPTGLEASFDLPRIPDISSSRIAPIALLSVLAFSTVLAPLVLLAPPTLLAPLTLLAPSTLLTPRALFALCTASSSFPARAINTRAGLASRATRSRPRIR
jgi:hypothetical protein